jgi:hypothetical protein
MAGTGKSTIARTLAREWSGEKRLGASFFFSRDSSDPRKPSKFFTTLAYQLTRIHPEVRTAMCQAVNEYPDIAEQGLREQWEHLVLRPLSSSALCKKKNQSLSVLLVLDALDECEEEERIGLILELLTQAKGLKFVSLRCFITSRPDTPIIYGFSNISRASHQDFIQHNMPESNVSKDISLFLQHELEIIKKKRYIHGEWPKKGMLDKMVERAGGLFIYASTMCRFIGEKGSDPKERLISAVLHGDPDGKSPIGHLDSMYIRVLQHTLLAEKNQRIVTSILKRFKRVVGAIMVLADSVTAEALAELICISRDEVEDTLALLGAVLDRSNVDCRIRFLHISFRDFLLDPRRCHDVRLRIDCDKMHEELFKHCMKMMSDNLKTDICGLLHLPCTLTSEISHQKIHEVLPPQTRYACLHWYYHLQGIQPNENANLKASSNNEQIYNYIIRVAHTFLEEYLLCWLEALGLITAISEGILMLKNYHTSLLITIVST